jgi:hypothetical protein
MKKRTHIPEPSVWEWQRIDARTVRAPNGCLLWVGATNGGYGAVSLGGVLLGVHRVIAAHRLGWDVSDPRTVVRHSCDTRACCEPSHLLLGTHKENAADREAAGRHYVPATDPNQPG